MEAINLDLLPGAMPPIVHVSQGDIGRQFQISIYDDSGSAYALAGKDLFIVGHKGDGNVFRYPIPSSAISDNIVTITTEEQMTPVAGKVLCEISIEYDGTVLGTCNFIMDVEQGPADLGPLSESTLYIIQTLFQQAEADIAAASAAETSATASAAAASTSETNAAASAVAAAASETNAANSATSAASSASDAHDSANSASSSATSASSSATNAANSATSAASSATNAASSESNAATSESNAHDSEVAAAASASSASSSASSASTSATNAAASETKIANMTVSAQSVSYTEEAEVVKTVVGDVYNLDFKIPKGQPTSGHEVIANPSGASTGGDLTKLGIDGVNYDLAGGSEIIVNPSGEVANTYISTLKIDGQTYGINNVPINVINKYEISPSKLLTYDGHTVIADFSGKLQTYNITLQAVNPKIVFEVYDRRVDGDGDWAAVFSPLTAGLTKYVQVHDTERNRYTMQATTQPPIISKVTTPVDLGAMQGYIHCLLHADGLYTKIYNKELPILVNGNAAELYGISVRYCVDNYVDGEIESNFKLKFYITVALKASFNDIITVDYSSSYHKPTYIIEDTNTTTVYSDTSYNPIITPYPTFS